MVVQRLESSGLVAAGTEPGTVVLGELGLQHIVHAAAGAEQVGHGSGDAAVGGMGKGNVPLFAMADGFHPPILQKQRNR